MDDLDETTICTGYLVGVHVLKSWGPGYGDNVVELELVQTLSEKTPSLRYRFSGVTDLTVDHTGGLTVAVLAAQDILGWQLEGARYLVREREDDAISFKCSRWEAI